MKKKAGEKKSRGFRVISFRSGPVETNKNLIGVTDKFRNYISNPDPITNKEKMLQAGYELILPIIESCGENFSRKELWDKCGNVTTAYDSLLEDISVGKSRGFLQEIRLREPKGES